MEFLFNLISGISLGSIYAIIALGYTMVYGIAKMLNFAHGDVIMVGAYICFFATMRFGMPPLAGVLLSMVGDYHRKTGIQTTASGSGSGCTDYCNRYELFSAEFGAAVMDIQSKSVPVCCWCH